MDGGHKACVLNTYYINYVAVWRIFVSLHVVSQSVQNWDYTSCQDSGRSRPGKGGVLYLEVIWGCAPIMTHLAGNP